MGGEAVIRVRMIATGLAVAGVFGAAAEVSDADLRDTTAMMFADDVRDVRD